MNTRYYINSHGKRPTGYGLWICRIHIWNNTKEAIMHEFTGEYKDLRASCKAATAGLQISEIVVMP